MASGSLYGQFALSLLKGQIGDLTAASLKVLITTSGYAPDVDADQYLTDVDVATNEVSGSGYSRLALTGVTAAWNAAANKAVVSADPAVWSPVTFTGGRVAVIYIDSGSAATSRLVGWVDFGADKSPAAQDFQLSFSAGLVEADVLAST